MMSNFLIDIIKEKVLVFRDHIGIKNVCYFVSDSSIYLSSSFFAEHGSADSTHHYESFFGVVG